MKTLIFAAAVVATGVGFCADTEFAEDSVYTFTFTGKTLQPIYGYTDVEEAIESDSGYATKAKAQSAASKILKELKKELVEDGSNTPRYRSLKTVITIDEEAEEDAFGWEIWGKEFNQDDPTDSKVITQVFNGIYVSDAEQLVVWSKGVKCEEGKNKGKYLGYAVEPNISGAAFGKKAIVSVDWDTFKGVGTGTCHKNGDDVYCVLKSIGGNFTGATGLYDTIDDDAYGTWKFSKDNALSDKGMSVEQVLAKKNVELVEE